MIVFQLIAVPLAALLFLRSAVKFLRGKGHRWVAALTAAIWLAAGITILQPEVTNTVARLLGIGRGADLVLYVLALSFLVALVYFYHKVRRLNSDLTEIVRTLAIRDALNGGSRGLVNTPKDPPAERSGMKREAAESPSDAE
ncbi:MAG: DUF2304 domain-containing protein [Gemmatimonadales bacterium]|nr:DUF2304 domain-containing protein [Gemmatimonadales bacterium]